MHVLDCVKAGAVLALVVLIGCQQNSGGGSYIECGGPKEFVCPEGMFCELTEECGGIDRWGICKRIPTDCENYDSPVCGCDNKTYANECYARASLASIAYEGRCLKQ